MLGLVQQARPELRPHTNIEPVYCYLDGPHAMRYHTQDMRHQLVHFTEVGRWESKLTNMGIAKYVPWKETSLVRVIHPSCYRSGSKVSLHRLSLCSK